MPFNNNADNFILVDFYRYFTDSQCACMRIVAYNVLS
jgi:hypothetical protein